MFKIYHPDNRLRFALGTMDKPISRILWGRNLLEEYMLTKMRMVILII